jgi:hypothetical protein
MDRCCSLIAENYKFKVASISNPPVEKIDIDKLNAIRTPLTIEHPLYTDKEIFQCIKYKLENDDALKDKKIWGPPPDDESKESIPESESESESSEGSEMEEYSDEDSEEEERERSTGPATPPPTQNPHPTKSDKRPPSKVTSKDREDEPSPAKRQKSMISNIT